MAQALYFFQDSLRKRQAIGDALTVPHSLDAIGWVATGIGAPARGALLLGAAQGLAEAVGTLLLPLWQNDRERAAELASTQLGQRRFDELVAQGRSLTLDQAVDLGLAPIEGDATPSRRDAAAI
jgi:non-specific serine/threonine protein kinase